MAEIVGLVGTALQLVDLAVKARDYIKDFQDVPKEQLRLLAEIKSLDDLVTALDKRIVKSRIPGSLNDALQQLNEPLLQLKVVLERLTKKLGDLSKVSSRFAWPVWGREEVTQGLDTVGRLKSLLDTWLDLKIWTLPIIKGKTTTTPYPLSTTPPRSNGWITIVRLDPNFFKSLRNVARNQEEQHDWDIFNSRELGTGQWFLQDSRFIQWRSGTGKKLWWRGMPGAGKTVLTSIVVDHLRADTECGDIGVAAIYLSHKEASDTQSPSSLLAALWRQLVFTKPVSPIVHRVYEKHCEPNTRPSLEDSHAILCSAISDYRQVFILVDALDEYPEDQLNVLLSHLAALRPLPNLLLTSRPHITIGHIIPHSDIELMEIRASEADVHLYVDAQISKFPRLSKHVANCPALREEISDGMFLLAKLHIDSLKTKLMLKTLRDTLATLPSDLKSTYDEVMTRINQQDEDERNIARRTLIWVALSKRPLRPSELQEAVSVDPEARSLDPDNLPDLDTILFVCGGLVVLNGEDDTISLIHYTTQNYLDNIQAQEFPQASTYITSACITYLSFETFSQKLEGPEIESLITRDLFRNHGLLDYAVKYCLKHARGEPETNLRTFILSFIADCAVWRHIWNWTHVIRVHKISPSASRLRIAAFFHLGEICRYLIQNEGPGAVLQEAASTGDTDVVRILLNNGADVNVDDSIYGTAMHAALQSEYNYGVLQLLIEHGADVNADGGDHGSTLYAASHQGNYMSSRLLLEHGAKVNTEGPNGETALYTAAYEGRNEIGRLLIEHGANVNAKGGAYGTALNAAVYHRRYMFARLLLKHGAKVNDTGPHDKTALYLASSIGQDQIVRLLLEHGADIHCQGGEHVTILNAAASNGRYKVAHFLLEHAQCPDVNEVIEVGGYLWTVLATALYRDHGALVRLFIKHGADVNGPGGCHGTILNAASFHGNYNHVRILLVNGAEVDARGRDGETPLYTAACKGHVAIARLLVDHGADVNATGGVYGSPLIVASANGQYDVVRLLIDLGANIHTQVESGGYVYTPISAASSEYMVHLLESAGDGLNLDSVIRKVFATESNPLRAFTGTGEDVRGSRVWSSHSTTGRGVSAQSAVSWNDFPDLTLAQVHRAKLVV
ncbi:ankyrin repeat-containing domain protein [Mycena crocata]|nr:ankyrin repeat-containing domain protein [Mycena crocata]